MRRTGIFLIAAALAGMAGPASAFGRPDLATAAPIEHVREAAEAQPAPYAMNYADDAARTLGVKDGRWQAFDTGGSSRDPLLPSLNGGVDAGGAMLRLQWR